MESQVKSYYADFWQTYGLTPLTIWDLYFDDFIPMTEFVDKLRREAER